MRKYLLPVLVALSVLAVIILLTHPDQLQHDAVELWEDFSTLTQDSDGTHSITIPIDSTSPTTNSLAIRSSLQTFTVTAGDTVLYEYLLSPHQLFGSAPPSRWHFITVPYDTQSDVVITYASPYASHQGTLRMYVGSLADLLYYVNQQSFPALMLSILCLLAGLLLLLIHMILRNKHGIQLVYLGIFLIIFAIWSWGESRTYYFNYTGLFWQSQITFLCAMILPLPVSMACFPYCKGNTIRINQIYIALVSGSAILATVLQLLNIVDYVEYLLVTQVLLVAGCLLLLFIRVKWFLEQDRQQEFFVTLGFLVLILSIFIEVFLYLSSNFFLNGITACAGVLFFALTLSHHEIRILQKQRTQSLQLQLELENATSHLMSNQMKPHFIHNTLLAIQESCYRDPQQAYDAIGMFSRYIRASLEEIGTNQLVPFQTELQYVNLYINIQKLCYEDSIDYSEDISFSNFEIPPFSIQPLVENAISHGIRRRRGTGSVHLKVYEENNSVIISIFDNGVGFVPSTKSPLTFSSSAAVVYRIEKLLEGSVDIASQVGEGTTVTIQFPIKSRKGGKFL